MSECKRTPLYDAHVAAGATMVDFGGWDMPIQYPDGIVTEHLYTRKHCGIFDVSHMGRLLISGPERLGFLQKVLSSDASKLVPGRAQYCMIPTESGGAVDDAYLYMFEEDKYLLIVNAANTDKDLAHFAPIAEEFDCHIENITDSWSSIAVQGPEAERILKTLSGGAEISGPRKNDLNVLTLEGHKVWVSKTGYTGEPIGWELFIDASEVTWLWERLQQLGAKPIGLGARDTLRLEAGLPLYGHELGSDPEGTEIPIFAVSLARFAVSMDKGHFIGREALAKQFPTKRRIVPILLTDRGVIRAGMTVYQGDTPIGWVTSGTMVPYYHFEADTPLDTTGKRSIGFAYVDSSVTFGDSITVDVRGKRLKAQVVKSHLDQRNPPYARPIL